MTHSTVDVNAVYKDAATCVCGALIEEIEDSDYSYSYWLHVKRIRIYFDHAAVPQPARPVIPEPGHVYACCGKTGRISRHESWCPVMAGTT